MAASVHLELLKTPIAVLLSECPPSYQGYQGPVALLRWRRANAETNMAKSSPRVVTEVDTWEEQMLQEQCTGTMMSREEASMGVGCV